MRFVAGLGVLLQLAGLGLSDEHVRALRDPPRWRLRAALTQGVGGSSDGGNVVTVFPMTFELGARLWGPLSLTAAAQGVLVAEYTDCGEERRPNAALGTLGLRVDLANGRSASWLAPFVELHGGVGGQRGGHAAGSGCKTNGVFGSGGARLGLDVWLGRVAVTVAATYDYLPTTSPFSVALGATFALY